MPLAVASTQRQDAQRFLRKAFLLGLPVFLILGFSTLVLYGLGEVMPVDAMVALQQKPQQVLIGIAYSEPTPSLKLRSILSRKPEILILGNSRINQMRSWFFKNPSAFFNGGGSVEAVSDFRFILSQIPEGEEPKMILLGLDPYFFHPSSPRWTVEETRKRFHPPSRFSIWRYGVLRLYGVFSKNPSLLQKALFPEDSKAKRIGLYARIGDLGYQNDGAYYRNSGDEKFPFPRTMDRIREGGSRFQYSEDISPAALKELEGFLAEAEKRKMDVIGFLPPFTHFIYETMKGMDKKYEYVFKLPFVLKPMFASRGYRFYDYSDMDFFEAPDAEAIDGFHGSEKTFLRLFLSLIAQDKPLARFSADVTTLKARLARSTNPFQMT